MRGARSKYCPSAVTPGTAKYRSSAESEKWTTLDEMEWLTRLERGNPQAFLLYKQNFYHRTQWGRLDPVTIARHLGLAWPNPQE
jgi:hypothetical protein